MDGNENEGIIHSAYGIGKTQSMMFEVLFMNIHKIRSWNFDKIVKSRKLSFFVIPGEAGHAVKL